MEKVVHVSKDELEKEQVLDSSGSAAVTPETRVENPVTKEENKTTVLRSFNSKSKRNKAPLILAVIGLLSVASGVGTGYALAQSKAGGSNELAKAPTTVEDKSKGEAGAGDDSIFKDTAEGKLVEGGIKGEGTHHLDRNLGEDKYVYLSSTVIDLQSFVGKNVEVWGEAISGQSAGWLMDVGKIKVKE